MRVGSAGRTEPPSADPGRIRRLQRRLLGQVDVVRQEDERQGVAKHRTDHPQAGQHTWCRSISWSDSFSFFLFLPVEDPTDEHGRRLFGDVIVQVGDAQSAEERRPDAGQKLREEDESAGADILLAGRLALRRQRLVGRAQIQVARVCIRRQSVQQSPCNSFELRSKSALLFCCKVEPPAEG